MSPGTAPRPPAHDRRVFLLALAGGLPGVALSVILLWVAGASAKVIATVVPLLLLVWIGTAVALRGRVVRSLQTLANLLAALREEDFSIRGRAARGHDALSDAMAEVNALAATLREQRLGAIEATALLRKVMDEIDVALFAFDGDRRLRLVNRAGERLLGQPAERARGSPAAAIGLADCLEGPAPRNLDLALPGGGGRWELRRGTFRQEGRTHQLLVLSDLSRALRGEERQAWQRLVRVIGHELNNSLAPIKSIAGSLADLIDRDPPPADWRDDMRRGLEVIAGRADGLGRFMDGYARLARLPQPRPRPVDLEPLIRRVAGLETRLAVEVRPGPPARIQADGDQIEQLLINLVHNAADAALEARGGVRIGWGPAAGAAPLVEVWVEDDGPGLPDSANLFVPFFTTKRDGSGIGLVLSRQIAEAHGGTLALENRRGGPGCRARLRLPV